MKSILGTTALAALLIGAGVTTVQAEGGADRLMDYRLQQEMWVSDRASPDSGERFARMIEQQPTAAGGASDRRDRQMQQQEDRYKSPIRKERTLYGSPH